MSEADSDSKLHGIVVGDGRDGVVRTAAEVFHARGVPYHVCADVYQAAGRMAGNGSQALLVAGRLEVLGRDGGRFFEIARRRGHACCCVATAAVGREAVLLSALAGSRRGLTVCGESAWMETLDRMTAGRGVLLSGHGACIDRLRPDEIGASRAEMEALFEHRVNDESF